LLEKFIDGPMKAALYCNDLKRCWLKNLSKQDVEKPVADPTATMLYYRHPGRNIVERSGIDQYGGDIVDYPCSSIAVA
jgi:hypothetical protein